MIECYAAMCQHHSLHHFSDDGPFCGTQDECVLSSVEHPIFFFAGKRNDGKYVKMEVLKTRPVTGKIKYSANGETVCLISEGIPTFKFHDTEFRYNEFESNLDVEKYAETVLQHHGMKIVDEIA